MSAFGADSTDRRAMPMPSAISSLVLASSAFGANAVTALVPSLKRPSDIRHTLTVLPALPKLSPLLRREPYPCSSLHRTPPPLARLEGVAQSAATIALPSTSKRQ